MAENMKPKISGLVAVLGLKLFRNHSGWCQHL